MAFAAPVLPFLIGGLAGGAASLLSKPKAAPKQAAPVPTARVQTQSVVTDALMRRRGSLGNRRTGAGGAESSAGGKKALMGT